MKNNILIDLRISIDLDDETTIADAVHDIQYAILDNDLKNCFIQTVSFNIPVKCEYDQ